MFDFSDMPSSYGMTGTRSGFRVTGRSSRGRVTAGPVAGGAVTGVAKKPVLSKKARTAWEQAIAGYGPEGGYGKGVEAGLKRGKTQAVASGMQSLVSAGLAGTTMAAGIGKKYEEEVATPARARVEETRAIAIANLKAALAGAEQRGYETAEDRALRERLANLQVSSQERLASKESTSPSAAIGTQYDRPDADGGGYADPGTGYGGAVEPEVRGAGPISSARQLAGRGPSIYGSSRVSSIYG